MASLYSNREKQRIREAIFKYINLGPNRDRIIIILDSREFLASRCLVEQFDVPPELIYVAENQHHEWVVKRRHVAHWGGSGLRRYSWLKRINVSPQPVDIRVMIQRLHAEGKEIALIWLDYCGSRYPDHQFLAEIYRQKVVPVVAITLCGRCNDRKLMKQERKIRGRINYIAENMRDIAHYRSKTVRPMMCRGYNAGAGQRIRSTMFMVLFGSCKETEWSTWKNTNIYGEPERIIDLKVEHGRLLGRMKWCGFPDDDGWYKMDYICDYPEQTRELLGSLLAEPHYPKLLTPEIWKLLKPYGFEQNDYLE